MTTTTRIQDLAREASEWFEVATRADSESTYVRTKEDAPEWVKELVYAAHGGMEGMLPDDWRYDKIQDALEYIAEVDDPEDSAEFADQAVDIYTHDRLTWLSSNLNRAAYCDEASRELGGCEHDIIGMIGLGQYEEAGEIYGLVLRALEDLAEVES